MENHDSEYFDKLLQMPDKVEALQWLMKGGDRYYIGEMSHDDSIAIVRVLYKLGAIEVIAVDIGNNAGLSSTDTLIVSLPGDLLMRENLFKWNNERVNYMGLDPDADRGQKYLLVWFD